MVLFVGYLLWRRGLRNGSCGQGEAGVGGLEGILRSPAERGRRPRPRLDALQALAPGTGRIAGKAIRFVRFDQSFFDVLVLTKCFRIQNEDVY